MMKRKSCKWLAALVLCVFIFYAGFAGAEIGINPALPPEQDVFGVEPLDPPDPESRDYIIVSDVKNEAESFNNEMRQTRNIAISGKTLVFQAGHSNQLYNSYNDNNDIKTMEIYAEKLIIRNPLNLPQTNVVIYAGEVRFEDPDDGTYAQINTTPRDKRDVDPGNNADGSGRNGINGLDAGNISLFIESIYADDTLIPIYCFNPFTWEQDICGYESPKRFIMTGSYGQKAGPGTSGVNGTVMDTWYSKGWSQAEMDRWAYHTVYIVSYERDCFLGWCGSWKIDWDRIVGSDVWPTNGTDAKPAGKPGNPGNGGSITVSTNFTNDQMLAYVSNSGGYAGQTGYYQYGGSAGYPNPAYKVQWKGGWGEIGSHTSTAGKDAPAPEPDIWYGSNGSISVTGHTMSWFHPYALKMILAHAKDTYLFKRNMGAAKEILEEYDSLLTTYKEYPEWLALPAEWQNDFNQMHGEIQILLHRIDSNLDYFGNPAGWVPMLSFEVTKAIYEKEIEHAIRVLYLSYWLGNSAGSLQEKINAMTALRDELENEVILFKQQYETAVTLIPKLQTDSLAISNKVDFLQKLIEDEENKLLARAEANVEDRNKVPTWKKIAQVAGTICTLCPVYQPALGAIGTGLNIAAKYDPDKPWDTIKQLPDISKAYKSSDSAFANMATKWNTAYKAFDAASYEKDKSDYLKKLGNVGKQFEPMGKELLKMKDVFEETKIPKNEIEAELQKLKAESPEFKSLVEDIQKLMIQKEEFARNLADTMQKVTVMADNITHNILAGDKLTQDITVNNAVLDQRALSYLQEMERRAKDRLLKYHYYLAKAYEYRMLKEYTGELNLQSLFDKFLAMAEQSSGGSLSEAQFIPLLKTFKLICLIQSVIYTSVCS